MMDKGKHLKAIAENHYRSGQWLCSEAIVMVINDIVENPLPPQVVKLASGFPVGIGAAGCSCGALTGGVMALGLAYGRTEPGEDNAKILRLSKELHDWFIEKYGSTCCRVLVKKVEFGGAAHMDQCTGITGAVAEFVAHQIEKEGSSA